MPDLVSEHRVSAMVETLFRQISDAPAADQLLIWRVLEPDATGDGEKWQLAREAMYAFLASPGFERTKAGYRAWHATDEGANWPGVGFICNHLTSWRRALDIAGYEPEPSVSGVQLLARGPLFTKSELIEVYEEWRNDPMFDRVGILSYRRFAQDYAQRPDRRLSRVPTCEYAFKRFWPSIHHGAVEQGLADSLEDTDWFRGAGPHSEYTTARKRYWLRRWGKHLAVEELRASNYDAWVAREEARLRAAGERLRIPKSQAMTTEWTTFAQALRAATLIDDDELTRRLDHAPRTPLTDDQLIDWAARCLNAGRFSRARYIAWREGYLTEHPEVKPAEVPKITQISHRLGGIKNARMLAAKRRDEWRAGEGQS